MGTEFLFKVEKLGYGDGCITPEQNHHLFQYKPINSHFIKWGIAYNLSFTLMLNLSQIWKVGAPQTVFFVLFDIFPLFFYNFLNFSQKKNSRVILYFPWPSLEISHCFKESLFLLVENDI